MLKSFLNNPLFINSGRWWLTGMLFFIPFQHRIYEITQHWSKELATGINRLDEMTLLIFLPLSIGENYSSRSYNPFYFLILFPVLILISTGFISGILNGNPLLTTVHGILDYVKSFLIIFIYAAFFKEFKEFKKIFLGLLIITVLLGIVAFMQEIWATYSVYMLEKDIHDPSVYLLNAIAASLSNSYIATAEADNWRFGLYRVASLLSHYNLLGLFSLFILTFYLYTARKMNFMIFLAVFMGILFSISRVAYAGFLFLIGLKISKRWRMLIILVIFLFVVSYLYILFFQDFDPSNRFGNLTFQEESSDLEKFRRLAMNKSMEVWKDYPFWGAGPGMFGGAVAFKYHSPVYEEYNFFQILTFIYSLDQFWPQLLAEMGIIGAVTFAALLISIFITFLILGQRIASDEIKGLFNGLAVFTVIFVIYTFGGNLNNVSILYPYCAFVGIGLGCSKKRNL
jgi:hypothetical protein